MKKIFTPLILFFSTFQALCQHGSLQTTFNGTGRLTAPLPYVQPTQAMSVQPDGSLSFGSRIPAASSLAASYK